MARVLTHTPRNESEWNQLAECIVVAPNFTAATPETIGALLNEATTPPWGITIEDRRSSHLKKNQAQELLIEYGRNTRCLVTTKPWPAQGSLLPSHLGHGWFMNQPIPIADADYEASSIFSSGHHVAIFMESPTTVRIWHSEVASTDPIDKDNYSIARWFDFRNRRA